MSSEAKLEYNIIYATSYEEGHDAEQLVIRNNVERTDPQRKRDKGNGWECDRFCEYPQELVIATNHTCEISQIQLLSHQSKIASKVEIWVGFDPNNAYHDSTTYKSINWRRLGYLSLDKNERSNWKARELKSVYINATANYVKFSLHEPHINTANLFNQIGIVGLSILGKVKSQRSSDELLMSNEENYNQQSNANYGGNKSDAQSEFDENTTMKIRELTILKKQAVQNEDYDEAKRCKLCIENLRSSAKQLFILEKEKRVAVEMEDYDKAKELKLKIERIRALSLNPEAANNAYSQPQQQPIRNQSNNMMQPMINNMANMSIQPQIAPAQPSNNVHFGQPQVVQQAQQQHQQQPIGMGLGSRTHSLTQSPNFRQNASIPPQQQQQVQQQSFIADPSERAIRPMRKPFQTMDLKNANPFGDDNPVNNALSPLQPQQEQQPVIVNEPYQEQKEDKDGPPELKASVRKGSEKAIEMFGEYNIRLLNSPKVWSHRDKGLKNVISFLNKKEHPDSRQVFKLTAKIIYAALQDRVAGIILTGVDVLNSLISVYGEDEVDSNEMVKCLHSIIIILVNILGNNNNRLIDAAGSILITLCHHSDALCRTIYNVLIKRMKKLLPKHLKGRGLILLQLIPEFNLPKGCDLNSMMDNLIKPQLQHKNGDVRDIGIQITVLLYQVNEIRNRVISYLESAGLNDFIKESLNNMFEEVSGNANVLQRDAKSIKEQSRPSKTMNRAASKPANPRKKRNTNQRSRKQQQAKKRSPPKQQYQAQQQRQQQEEDNEEEREDVCNFCGLQDDAFLENEENLDLHYWQSCPMLTSCKLCEQVIEIATLHEHILNECESGIKHKLCQKCNVPYPLNSNEKHINCPSSGMKCPLCLNNISSSPDAWKQHLLKYPGCPSNPRPLVQ